MRQRQLRSDLGRLSLLKRLSSPLFERTDLPKALQGGELTGISPGDDVWIGANAVVMSDVHSGAIVGAGAVVTRPVVSYRIAAGNPAREIGRRTASA